MFEVGDAYKENEICLTKDVTQLKARLKVQIEKVEDLNKQILEMNKQKETTKSKCLELETTIFGLIQEVEQAQELNETLKKSLLEAHVDMLSVGDKGFERAQAQELCLKPDLNVSEMDFFKTMVDGRLMDMEEASPKARFLSMR